eukprot:TCONS_00052608-protein
MKLFQDKGREREILGIMVKCTNNQSGCKWQNELRQLETHQSECGYEETQCVITLCSKRVQRRLLEQHHSEECDYRFVTCLYCTEEYMHYDEEEHIFECEEFLLCCDFCTESDIPRKKLNDHLSNYCTKVPHSCPFETIGCREKLMLEDLVNHKSKAIEKHLMLALDQIKEQKIELSAKDQRITGLENEVRSRHQQQKLCALNEIHTWELQNFKQNWKADKASFSKCFYSPQGYKINARLGPKKDDQSVSIWFTTLEGPFDDTLEWPMNVESISCCVVDSEEKVYEIFELESEFLKDVALKPPHNDCVGWEVFIPSDKLSKYLNGDNLTIRIQIKS